MPKVSNRVSRVEKLIQKKLSVLIRDELNDPRLKAAITISEVRVTSDFSYAKVYVTSLADKDILQESLEILNRAAGFLRKQLSQEIQIRIVPQLTFIEDTLWEEGNRLTKLIEKAVAKDEDNEGKH